MTVAATAARPFDDRWAVLALAILARTFMAVQFQSVGALGPTLLADTTLGISYGGLGALIGAYMLPGIALALPSGWLAARHGERRIVLSGLALMTAGGLLLALAEGTVAALTGRAVAGAGGALLNVILTTMVMGRFAGSTALVPALGGMLAAWPLGVVLALVALPPLTEMAGGSWRLSMLAVALACGAALALTVPVLQARPQTQETAGSGKATGGEGPLGLRPGELGPVCAAGVAWVGQNVAFATLLGFAPAILADRGWGLAAAGLLASVAGWARIPLLPFGGALAERTGRPLLTASLLHAASAAAVLLFAFGAGMPALWAAVALLAAGLLSTPPGPVIMSLPARALSPETRAIGMGVFYTFFYAGMAGLPLLAGLAGDITGSTEAPLLATAAFHVVAIGGMAAFAVLTVSCQMRRS